MKMAGSRILEKYNHKKLGWLHDFRFFFLAAIVIFILFKFVIGLSAVDGESMEPSLHDGEVAVYNRLAADYKPGDVISIRVPSGEYYVKRVIALAGDVVDLQDGNVYVNGDKLEDTWSVGSTYPESIAVNYPYKVREGNVFVLGDNREASLDSRHFGEVNKIQIKGKLVLHVGKWYVKGI